MTLAQFAKENNMDASALNSLASFLISNINRNPELKKLMAENPALVIQEGVKAWYESSSRFFNELLEGKTERAIEMKQQIARDVWEEAQRRKVANNAERES